MIMSLSILTFLTVMVPTILFARDEIEGPVSAEIVRVIDGDTRHPHGESSSIRTTDGSRIRLTLVCLAYTIRVHGLSLNRVSSQRKNGFKPVSSSRCLADQVRDRGDAGYLTHCNIVASETVFRSFAFQS